MIKTRKENRISASPLDLLNNIKYVKSERKTDHNISANQFSFKKSQTMFKKIDKPDDDLIYSMDPTKKAYNEMKISTYRSPLKRDDDHQRKSLHLKKKDMQSLSRQDIKSIESMPRHNAGQSYRDTYGRTVRFKTQQSQKHTKQTTARLSQKSKIMLEGLNLPQHDNLKNVIMTVKDRLSNISHNVQISGMTDSNFICQLIAKFKQLLLSLVQKCLSVSLQKVQQHQKNAAQLMESVQEMKKQQSNMEGIINKLREQNDIYRVELEKFSRLTESQRVSLQDKCEKQRQVNILVYGLRLSGIDVDGCYRRITDTLEESSRASKDETSREERVSNITI